jgi:hypothetical protein
MYLHPSVDLTTKIKAYIGRYGMKEWDIVERGTLSGYYATDCWDLAYDALLQDKKLEFFWADKDMTDLQYRYIAI